jgi:NTP pyrophosphatase (non-canonical NTP hydrolase)
MSDHLIIGKKPEAAVLGNLALTGASVPELLGEIERRGISLPQTSFQLIQSLHAHRNSRWNADNGGRTLKATSDAGPFHVHDADGNPLATFTNMADAVAFANPQFTCFERAAEVAGEVGELVNAVKKLRRHEMKMPGNYKPGEDNEHELHKRAAYELGDVLCTVFNLANKLQFDAYDCLQLAFNTKSDEMGFPEKI